MSAALCVAGERCRGYDRFREPPGPAYVESGCPLCGDCLVAAERDVRALVADYAGLEQLLPRSLGQWSDGQPNAGERGEQPMVLRQQIAVLQGDICWVTTAWAHVLTDRARLSDPPHRRVREGWVVQWAVGILVPRVELLARVDWSEMWDYPVQRQCITHERPRCQACHQPRDSLVAGVDGLVDLQLLHAAARLMLGLQNLVRVLPGECPNPKCPGEAKLRSTLRQNNGSNTVWCTDCEHHRPYDDYERYLKLIVWDG